MVLCTYFTPAVIQTNKVQFCKSCNKKYVNNEQAEFASILTEDNGIYIPGSKFKREAEEYPVDQLKRWLKWKHEHMTDFNGSERLLSLCIINELFNGMEFYTSCHVDITWQRHFIVSFARAF